MRRLILFLVLFLVFENIYSQVWNKIQLNDGNEPNSDIRNAANFGDTSFVISGKGDIIKTKNFFQSFDVDTTFRNAIFNDIYFPSQDTGYILSAYFSSGLLKTVDKGSNWLAFPSEFVTNPPVGNFLLFTNSYTGFTGNSNAGNIQVTYDGGKNWIEINIPLNECERIFQIKVTNDSIIYILSNDNIISPYFGFLNLVKSSNYGISWQIVSNINISGFGDFDLINDSTIILVTDFFIFKSINGGITFDTVWHDISNNNQLYNHSHSISFINQDTGFVAFGASVYKTYDAGDNWIKTDFQFKTDDTFNQINFIKAVSSDKLIVGCFNGNIYTTETGGGTWSNINETNDYNQIQLYPNPATNTLTISHQLQGAITYTIHAIDGTVILQNTTIQNQVEVDIAPLAQGMYFLNLQNNKQNIIKKFVKQ